MTTPRPSQDQTISVPPAPDLASLRRPVRIEVEGAAPAPPADSEPIVIRMPDSAAPGGGGRAPLPARRGASDRYAIEGELGRGGMGVVYRAIDRDLKRPVAMKVLLSSAGAGTELAARFVEEAQATAQLQHPGIVPVYEIGADADDRLFFTMKLVRGRTLAAVVEDARSGKTPDVTLFRLLQIFVEVARTVAYAHARSVIHRDLKPHNVMIGGHGEVHVMDWGLAKVVTEARAASQADAARVREERRARRESKEESRADSKGDVETDSDRTPTEFGALMGTPSYMPPEQARGHTGEVGPLSDVYALGATLYHILTGRPPFRGTTTAEIVERVLRDPPERPRALDRRVPAEVEAICLRAIAKAPADRYASADALADDVQRYLEGRPVSAFREGWVRRAGKLARRHRSITAMLALTIVVGVALLGIGFARETRLREAAEKSRARAEDLSDFMLFDLEGKLLTLGRLDILAPVARKALEQYDALPAEADAESQRRRGVALTLVGDILRLQGDLAAAMRSYEASVAALERSLARASADADAFRALLEAHDRIAETLLQEGRLEAALEEDRLVIELALARGPSAREDAAVRLRVSDAAVHSATALYDQGRLEDALASTAQARAEAAAVTRTAGSHVLEARARLAALDRTESAIAIAQGQSARALELIRAAHDASAAVVLEDREDDGFQDGLYVSTIDLADLERLCGLLDDALGHARAAVAQAERIVDRDPTNASWRAHLAAAHLKVGHILFDRGDADAALADLRAALSISERMVARDPKNRVWRRDLATAHDEIGLVLRDLRHDAAASLEHYRLAQAIRVELAADDPSNVLARLSLAESHEYVGYALATLGDMAPARAEYEAGLAMLGDALRSGLATDQAERERAIIIDLEAKMLANEGKIPEALEQHRVAAEAFDRLLTRRPADAPTMMDAARSHAARGDLLLTLGSDAAGAGAEFERAVAAGRPALGLDALARPEVEAMERKLRAARVAAGALPPETPEEFVAAGYARYEKKDFAGSAEAFERALADAGIRAVASGSHLYNGACAACMAAAASDGAARERWHARALEWLSAHIAIQRKRLADSAAELAASPAPGRATELRRERKRIIAALASARKDDEDLAHIRGAPEFERLFEGLPAE